MSLNQNNELNSLYKTVKQFMVGESGTDYEREELENMEKRYDNLESEDMDKLIKDGEQVVRHHEKEYRWR